MLLMSDESFRMWGSSSPFQIHNGTRAAARGREVSGYESGDKTHKTASRHGPSRPGRAPKEKKWGLKQISGWRCAEPVLYYMLLPDVPSAERLRVA